MKKRLSLYGAVILALVLALSACSQTKPATEAVNPDGNALLDVRIPDIYGPTSLFHPYIADAKGFYKEAGINPIFTGVTPPGQIVSAVVAGDNDIGYLHVNRTINGIAAGAKIKAVVANEETSKELPHMEYVVLDDGPLKTPTDIIGKKIGLIAIGGCNEYTPYEILRKYGIDNPKGQFEIIVIPAGNEEQVLRSKEVDVVGFHGHPVDAFANGNLRVLFDDYDVWGTVGGATPFYFREDFIENNPETVRRFVAAHIKTSQWIKENLEEAKKIQAERVGLKPDQISYLGSRDDGIIKEESIQVWLDVLKQYNELKVDLKATDVYTNEFNPNSPDYKF